MNLLYGSPLVEWVVDKAVSLVLTVSFRQSDASLHLILSYPSYLHSKTSRFISPPQQPGGRASAESIKNKKRVIKLVLIVVVLFALSWLPIHIILGRI